MQIHESIPNDLNRSRVLDSRQAADLCGFSLVHFRRLYRSGTLPRPLRLSARKLGWRTGDLLDFLDAKAREAA